jgi:hypothetical protein
MSIREPGPRGCLVVEVDNGHIDTEFVPLSRVCWETLEVNLEGGFSLDALETAVTAQLDKAREPLDNDKTLIVRIRLNGTGEEFGQLAANPEKRDEVLERFREQALDAGPVPTWIENLAFCPRPDPETIESRRQRPDFLGEIFRLSAELADTDSGLNEILAPALNELYNCSPGRTALTPLSPEEMKQILTEAENMCAGLLKQ